MVKSSLAKKSVPATRILLVEDDPSDAFIIGELLESQYETHHVKSQSEAIQVLDDGAFDVCLLDLTLPDAIGFSTLIDIQDKAPDMPVLVLTGINDTELARHAVARGAQDYLLKDELKAATLTRSIDYARERKRLEKELFQRANYDMLTGLANRSLFDTRLTIALARAHREGTAVALLFIDLDHFKPINDKHGHEAGDEVLKVVAQRIKGVLRPYDTPARLGGDEFAVLLEGLTSPRDAAAIAQKILREIAPPMQHQGKPLRIGASIGITFSDSSVLPEAMLKNADDAMYHAKKDGGGNFRFGTSGMQDKAESRLKAEEELSNAIASCQLRLHYQPYVGTGDKTVLGVEALLRWEHPERGMMPPGQFLSLAEESRLMPEIGKWMFSEIDRDIALWNRHSVPPLEIAFNLCASQMNAPDFIDWVSPLTQEGVLGHHKLVAEIESDALAFLSESCMLILTKLRETGIKLHLDHFGRNPVSLQLLHAFPFSLLKLDLSLMERMNGGNQEDALIGTAIGLAHQLRMKAGAVGVETSRQMQTLKAQRCDTLQGFLIGRPMTAAELPHWLVEAA